MSEYGRYMGPLFSIFSKWPTATAGKIAHAYMTEGPGAGSARTFQTLLIPYFTLMMADQLIDSDSDIYNRVVGSKGLKGWTQIDSLPTDFGVREGLLSTPIMAAGMDFFDAFSQEDTGKAITKWINNTFRSFFPGAGALRFLAEEIPLVATGEKQDKVTLLSE
jgi:hypothetical protein